MIESSRGMEGEECGKGHNHCSLNSTYVDAWKNDEVRNPNTAIFSRLMCDWNFLPARNRPPTVLLTSIPRPARRGLSLLRKTQRDNAHIDS